MPRANEDVVKRYTLGKNKDQVGRADHGSLASIRPRLLLLSNLIQLPSNHAELRSWVRAFLTRSDIEQMTGRGD
jgi:hypothetical protein